MKDNLVACSKCRWIHFQVDNEYISRWKKDWDAYWRSLSVEERSLFGLTSSPPTPESYYQCFNCGGHYKNMVEILFDDLGLGYTIQPILRSDQEKNTDWDK